jgi:hypothetical protein
MGSGVTDGGPWQGSIPQEEWISRISPWPTPWVVREIPSPREFEVLIQLEEIGIFFGRPGEVIPELEARALNGDR